MRETDLIDYTGMMEKVHERGWTLPIKVLHIDEGQDLSPLAHALAHQFGEVCSTVSWYGDSNQCQPAGEIVQTIKGPKDIKDIDPNIDQLYSYARCDGRIYGSCRGGKSFKKASHLYSGKIYTVQCGDRISKSTYNHRWLAKWRMEARDTGYNVVYLMEKNGWFRIGWCQLFNTIGRLHLTIRGNLEKAERIWILKLVDNKPDGSFYESLFAAQYGIPTILFKQVVGGSAAPYYTDAFIEKFFSMLDPVEQRSRVERLLKDCGKYFNCPIYDRDQAGTQTSSCIMEVHACNLIPELMSLVITDNLKTVEHETLDSITTTDVENEPVYGLDVDKYHTYITTSGIVTHNSIYRFAGAMPENFMDLPHTDEVILDQSYRCSPGIVNYANSVISKCRRWEQADYKPCMSYGEGKRYFLSEPDLSLPGTHMILSRAKYQVEPWIAWLIANGIPYYNPYRKDALMWNPCDTQIFRALRTHQALTAGEDVPLGDFLIMLKHTQAKHCFNARGGKKDADTMAKEAIAQKRLTLSIIDMDQMSFNPAFLEGQKGQGAWQSAQDFFLIKENNASELLKQMIARDTLTERPRVIVGTQHSIKGGSADYVWIDPAWPGRVRQNVIGKAGTQDYDDEVRLAYVAITRARRGVGIVHPKRGFDDGCIY